jgi:hypothetical protein
MQEPSAQIALRFSSQGSIHRGGREGMFSFSANKFMRKKSPSPSHYRDAAYIKARNKILVVMYPATGGWRYRSTPGG